MPHGVLTPLGRQLRSVLAGLRGATDRTPATGGSLHPHGRPQVRRTLASCGPLQHRSTGDEAAVAVAHDKWFDNATTQPARPDPNAGRSKGIKRIKGRTRRSYLTEALRDAGQPHAVPRVPKGKHDLSHVNANRPDGWKTYKENAERHRLDEIWNLAHTKDLTLERLVASCIQHRSTLQDTGQAEWNAPYRLTFREASFLSRQGYSRTDIETWAQSISMPDSHAAADALVDVCTSKTKPVPVFLLTFLLRRQYLKARALRILLGIIPQVLTKQHRHSELPVLKDKTVFVIFIRLLRHAREVWPVAIPAITDFLLTYLPKACPGDGAQIHDLTNMLNIAMRLVSVETAVEPVRDNAYQEAAIVRILRFMTEHQPQLQITREGYRAVVRVQLAQRKSSSEQQWAELKTLSWPPWKQDRTAMDVGITHEQHGISSAAATLRRMREAGYRPNEWEKTAELLAGWDVDGTPTIQTRALLGSGSRRFRSGAAIWAARITTTRTAQEAWAAYLAFEDAQLPASNEVHLAILQKLQGEEKRQRASDTRERTEAELARQRQRLLPGDMREVEPLPPSTHLYTYTRTPVPTVEGFFRHLQDRQIQLRGHALAFAVAKAARLRLGFCYLYSTEVHSLGIESLLSLSPDANTVAVPDTLLSAFIELLCRYSNVPLSEIRGTPDAVSSRPPKKNLLLDGHKLNIDHAIVFALELLRMRGTTSRPPWNAVLRALSREPTLASMRFLHVEKASRQPLHEHDNMQQSRGALLAYRLVRRTLSMLQDLHVDLDGYGFRGLCLATENAAVACWKISRTDVGKDADVVGKALQDRMLVNEVTDLLRSNNHVTRLKGLFRVLVGNEAQSAASADKTSQDGDSSLTLPSLLHIPSAALLHAYVRALGWMGDYDGLLALVRWMVTYRDELRSEQTRARNAQDLMRRVIVSIRVFLERSWLPDTRTEEEALSDPAQGTGDRRLRHLRRLEAAAPAGLVADMEELVGGVEEWGGWPSDEEVAAYCQNERFRQVRGLSQ